MKNSSTFGECLISLLDAFKIKCSKLARGINVDSSLIYRWVRNERVPAYNSPYVDLIVNFLMKNMKNSYQRKVIADVITGYGIEVSETDDNDIMSKIRTMLLEAQGCSIELYSRKKNLPKKSLSSILSIEDLLKSIDTHSSPLYTIYKSAEQSIQRPDEEITGNRPPSNTDNVEIVNGCNEILYSQLVLLKHLPKNPCQGHDTILITINSDINLLPEYLEFSIQWKQMLYNALKNGWKVISLVRLDYNIKRTVKIIEDMLDFLSTGNFFVYYQKRSNEISYGNELRILPETGALFCIPSQPGNQVDSAFLFHSRSSLDMLSSLFYQIFYSAKPLLQSFPSHKTTEFQQAYAEAEEIPGDRYVLKGGLSTVTIPLHLFEKYLISDKRESQIKSYRLFLHKRRLDAFEAQVKYYKFKNICIKESVEKLIKDRKYSFDEYYILEDSAAQNADITCHLENLIDILQKYDNYELAIVSNSDFKNLTNLCCMIKSDCRVLIETFDHRSHTSPGFDSCNPEMNFSVTEKEVVSAFRNYFMSVWDNIPEKCKEKKSTIEWLKSLIKELQ